MPNTRKKYIKKIQMSQTDKIYILKVRCNLLILHITHEVVIFTNTSVKAHIIYVYIYIYIYIYMNGEKYDKI